MQRDAPQSSARILAPLALALCAVAFFYVIFTAGSGDEGNGGGSPAARTTTRSKTTQTSQPTKSSYTVKTGDTLGGIAAKTGVSVERLQELNPGLDPQALVSGQKIKLRE